MSRVILHCDCNNFFASVETILNPSYKNVPLAVCGSEAARHGIVLAKNEIAKKCGIVTAETVYSARKKCPNLVIAEPHYDEYTKFSRRVNEIYARYTDIIEPFGIDESWLDVTASQRLFGGGEEIANKIRCDIKREIGITVSVGVSFNKVFAKLGSDYKKPDAVTVISEKNFKDIIFSLPVSDLLYVGRKTSEALKTMGIRTIGELAKTNREILIARFGKSGDLLHRYSNGLDDSPVESSRDDAKSVSNGFTFRHDLVGREECKVGIEYLAEEIGRRLRAQKQLCSTVSITIKDEYLRTIQRQRTLSSPTDVSREISDMAYAILLDEWSEEKPIRMITLSASNLVRRDMSAVQISMFDDARSERHKKGEKKENALDKIRQKYGNQAILNGAILVSDIGIYEHSEENYPKFKKPD